MRPPKTSTSHPLRIDPLAVGKDCGLIGLTFCPGKKQTDAHSGAWDRNLDDDMEAIKAFGAKALVTLMPETELLSLGVSSAGTYQNSGRVVHPQSNGEDPNRNRFAATARLFSAVDPLTTSDVQSPTGSLGANPPACNRTSKAVSGSTTMVWAERCGWKPLTRSNRRLIKQSALCFTPRSLTSSLAVMPCRSMDAFGTRGQHRLGRP